MADNENLVVARLTAQDTGTDWLQLRAKGNVFDLSLSGTFVGTVHLQRKRRDEPDSDAKDITSYTAVAEETGEVRGRWDVRLFCKTGNYTSGTLVCELGAGA